MKLISASFRNFRLLKNIDIEFARDPIRNVTVIRAANESGKTTMLMGLQWGLFGDECLPDKGRTYRLHPLDVGIAGGTRVEVTVAVDYEISGKGGTRSYRLIRSAVESVSGETWARENNSVQLFHLKREGADPLESPEAHIRPHLPFELREVLFTDGDRALSFIEGARGEQSKRVEGAIRSLLGLNVVEDAIKHVKAVGSQLNKKAKVGGNDAELSRRADAITTFQDQLPLLEEQQKNKHAEVLNLEDLKQDADQKLRDALRLGNREEMAADLERISKAWNRAEIAARLAAREQADLFRSQALARQLLRPAFERAKGVLDVLYDTGKIPNQTIPVLEERLEKPLCICGESLDKESADGRRRREAIQSLITASRDSDALQETVTALYYGARDLMAPVTGNGWIQEYSVVYERRQEAQRNLDRLGLESRALEAKIAAVPNVNVSQLKETRDLYTQQHVEAVRAEVRLEQKMRDVKEKIVELKQEMEKLLNLDSKGKQILAEFEVATDLESILTASLDTMKTRELKAVSARTNELFLKMIGADEEQNERAAIQKVQITTDFRIVVSGPNGRQLDPSQDLNGASRRALTIAFILALTRVSEVDARRMLSIRRSE